MQQIAFKKSWKKHLNATPQELSDLNGLSNNKELSTQSVTQHFEIHNSLHKLACKQYGEIDFQVKRLFRYQEADLAPPEWTIPLVDNAPKKDPSTTAQKEYLKQKFDTHVANLTRQLEILSGQVFYTESAITWCQEWVEVCWNESYRTPNEMYARMKSRNKSVVDFFVVECVRYFENKAVPNLLCMKAEIQARLSLVDSEIAASEGIQAKEDCGE
ncbi:hypothetical protein JCM33374_g2301 [Metschnikowia sp. JCM 33374]|nr:hypothetical protein JCM33374_g2301 [Metschnikowia sp. JCM 33374]